MHEVKPEVHYRIKTSKIPEASESHPLQHGFFIRNGFKYEFCVRPYLFVFGWLRVTGQHTMQASKLSQNNSPSDSPTILMISEALGIHSE
jgi:hypothetical protein